MRVIVWSRVTLQDLDVEFAAIEHRAGAVDPHVRKASIVLGQVTLPKLLAGKVKGRQIAGGKQAEHPLPVGRGRRRCHIVATHLASLPGHHLLPARLAGLSIQANQEQVLLRVWTGDENTIFPNHRRSTALTRQRRNPGHVIRFAPLAGQIALGGRAVEVRSAPLRPVLRTCGGRNQDRQAQRNKQASHKVPPSLLSSGLHFKFHPLSFASPGSICPASSTENRSGSSLSGPGSRGWPWPGGTMTSTSTGTPSALSFSMKLRRSSSQAISTQMQPLTTLMCPSTRCSSARNGWSLPARTDARISSIWSTCATPRPAVKQ